MKVAAFVQQPPGGKKSFMRAGHRDIGGADDLRVVREDLRVFGSELGGAHDGGNVALVYFFVTRHARIPECEPVRLEEEDIEIKAAAGEALLPDGLRQLLFPKIDIAATQIGPDAFHKGTAPDSRLGDRHNRVLPAKNNPYCSL